ncbi:hypothetical protein GPECTOR_11g8 [Gonium pectorale]|uniref:Uncharacterized protein n=1 Tax=Gonium pectorale TaxID=33097 RepID=A0A150GQ15_GONPE|nr:hypothetical protein GPECTOR_11g8 [Gonium pectorale]|eukprot:KXZ51956.1 hypothetical protein GPECTOR_11g8 [Gonium pectorale]
MGLVLNTDQQLPARPGSAGLTAQSMLHSGPLLAPASRPPSRGPLPVPACGAGQGAAGVGGPGAAGYGGGDDCNDLPDASSAVDPSLAELLTFWQGGPDEPQPAAWDAARRPSGPPPPLLPMAHSVTAPSAGPGLAGPGLAASANAGGGGAGSGSAEGEGGAELAWPSGLQLAAAPSPLDACAPLPRCGPSPYAAADADTAAALLGTETALYDDSLLIPKRQQRLSNQQLQQLQQRQLAAPPQPHPQLAPSPQLQLQQLRLPQQQHQQQSPPSSSSALTAAGPASGGRGNPGGAGPWGGSGAGAGAAVMAVNAAEAETASSSQATAVPERHMGWYDGCAEIWAEVFGGAPPV